MPSPQLHHILQNIDTQAQHGRVRRSHNDSALRRERHFDARQHHIGIDGLEQGPKHKVGLNEALIKVDTAREARVDGDGVWVLLGADAECDRLAGAGCACVEDLADLASLSAYRSSKLGRAAH